MTITLNTIGFIFAIIGALTTITLIITIAMTRGDMLEMLRKMR